MSVSYKDVLLNHLQNSGWEYVENLPIRFDTEVEVWRVRSFTINWGYELFLSFNRIQPIFSQEEVKGDEVTDIDLLSEYGEDPEGGKEVLANVPRKTKGMMREIGGFIGVMERLRKESGGD